MARKSSVVFACGNASLGSSTLSPAQIGAQPSPGRHSTRRSLCFWAKTVTWRWLLSVYPLAMAVSLLYLGEHYVSDLLLGGLYAILEFVFGGRTYDWWLNRHTAASEPPTSGDAAVT
jgi:PAP2 superfamily